MQRFLFELVAYRGALGVERRSPWVSDEWVADRLSENPDLDRIVEFDVSDLQHPLPHTPVFLPLPQRR